VKIRSWTQLVKDRKNWSEIVEQAKTHTGLWCQEEEEKKKNAYIFVRHFLPFFYSEI
jgi:hypothetical protein